MGCNGSRHDPETEVSRQIDVEMKEDKVRISKELKILLLGAGESGKTTVLKQMMLHYGKGFPEEYVLGQREHIWFNLYESIVSLIRACEKLKIPINDPATLERTKFVEAINSSDPFTDEMFDAFSLIWKDPDIQIAYSKSNEFQIIDSARYFMTNIERVREPNFIPNEQDVLCARSPTTGVSEHFFSVEKFVFRVVDVGGQRSERKKWLACFNDVTSVMFIVALSEFNQTLYEDGKTNRMTESLQLFRGICENRWFVQIPMIVFLNKQDLFVEKLQAKHSIKSIFQDYTGPDEFEPSVAFIQEKFNQINIDAMKAHTPGPESDQPRDVFFKITCATDKEQMKFVLKAVQAIIVTAKLKDAGL